MDICVSMKREPVRSQLVEHLTRLGDTSIQAFQDPNDVNATTYHYHTTVEVIIGQRGWVEGLVGEIPGRLQEGSVLVLGSDVPHCVLRASADCSLLLVHIPYELLRWDADRFPELAHGLAYLRACKSGMAYLSETFAKKLQRMARQIAVADGFLRMSLLLRMIHVLSVTPATMTLKAEQHPLRPNPQRESAIDRAYRYLYAHFREPFTLHDLSAYAGLNHTALCRAFKKVSGQTVMQFCAHLRIEYACNLLLTTQLKVTQIAYQSGYNSYPLFCAQFRKAMHMSPTEYRLSVLTR